MVTSTAWEVIYTFFESVYEILWSVLNRILLEYLVFFLVFFFLMLFKGDFRMKSPLRVISRSR